jgi:hypothetical protein
MNTLLNQKAVKPPRVALTESMWRHLTEYLMKGSVPELAKRTGLPYLLLYNLAHRRVKSVSARHYRIIFGQDPPTQTQEKIDGTYFRQLVELWLFLNDGASKADLFWEFYGDGHTHNVDYRIFTGKIRSVDPGWVVHMQNKFSAVGIDEDTLRRWIGEIAARDPQAPVPYGHVRPLLIFLKETVGIHPTKILHQNFNRYESGNLKTVSRKTYDNALSLKKKADDALDAGSRTQLIKLKEEIYGRKAGYTLYTDVEEELKFLKQYARKSLKKYLGRGTSIYTKGKCKRLPTWRAEKIMADCRVLIIQEPHLPLRVLPRAARQSIAGAALSVLKARMADLLSRKEGVRFEKRVLRPSSAGEEYKKQIYGFTRFDVAAGTLGMKRKAFDLMVAENSEIFRKTASYCRRWYLSNLYLKELSRKQHFDLISTKYEWLIKSTKPALPDRSAPA